MKKKGAVSDLRLKRVFELHKILRKSHRGRSADELRVACLDVDPDVDKRTTMNDLRFLRDALGAPLPDRANKHDGYYYSTPYSIFDGLDDSYLGSLNEALALLRQLSDAAEFVGLEDLLLRLEQRVAGTTDAEKNPIIAFDEAELVGREHLIGLYRAIQKQLFLRITYQPFADDQPMIRHVFPLLLKQYNNRWVLVSWENGRDTPQNLPLDRITSFFNTAETFTHPKTFDGKAYFRHLIGTTKTGAAPQSVVLRFTNKRGKYVVTKKIHPEQQTVWLPSGELEVRLFVELNQELEARILEFGADVEVLEPPHLRDQIRDNLARALHRTSGLSE